MISATHCVGLITLKYLSLILKNEKFTKLKINILSLRLKLLSTTLSVD